ncbi:YjjG family noncanonical pyrimidine nucleotidase [Levilactobacillus sp. HBUAS70063]|uniref:YjjG family noncanonical pyrimidine nucleotidase n=1 Tax=Levilactobacillus sp. HBUAS70063 TaxID=3109359 RepID=UPI0031331DD9
MKKYAIIDLDDTLLDFTRGENEGVTQLLRENGITDVQRGLATYVQINRNIWHQIELGADRKPLLDRRFTQAFGALGVTVDGLALEKQYKSMLDHNYYTLPGAAAFLANLKRAGVTVIAGTNGTKSIQLNRLRGSHLTTYFDNVFISEDVGFDKPDKRFFTPIFAQYPTMSAANTVMIGDSLHSDILGATNAHLDSIWFNPRHVAGSADYRPTHEVDSFTALEQLLLA